MSGLSYFIQYNTIEQIKANLKYVWGESNQIDIEKQDIYIWGIGLLGKFAIKQLKKNQLNVKGILTSDNKQIGMNYENIPFVRLDDIKVEDLIIVCSMAYPFIAEKLEYYGYKKYLYYEVIPFLYDGFDSYNMAFEGMWETLVRKRDSIKNLQKLFQHDEVSMEVLNDILFYRYTLKTFYLDHAFTLSIERGNIYFDNFIVKLTNNEVFVDCGGYTGDTTEAFIMNCHNRYNKIFLFEPDNKLINIARDNLKDYHNIFFYNEGVRKVKEKVSFDLRGSIGGGTISSEGKIDIMVNTLDDTVKDFKPTYIKMDIEGSEMQALYGGGGNNKDL